MESTSASRRDSDVAAEEYSEMFGSGGGEKTDMKIPTEADIKAAAKNYSTENIPSLSMPSEGWMGVGDVAFCAFLVDLNMSCNKIAGDLSALSSLQYLASLDLSFNLIESCNGIGQVTALKRFNLRGNRISSIDVLEDLRSLNELRYFSLSDLDGSAANPVCSLEIYHEAVLELMPSLAALDGRRLGGAASEFYHEAQNLEAAIDSIELTVAKSDALDIEANIPGSQNSRVNILFEAQKFDEVLQQCESEIHSARANITQPEEPVGQQGIFLTHDDNSN